MLELRSPRTAFSVISIVSVMTLLGAWAFEYWGFAPCELCLQQRWAYYLGAPLSGMLAVWNPPWLRKSLLVIGLLWFGSAMFGIYHSGVEWGWWLGPQACSGGGEIGLGEGLPDLSKTAINCNEAAIRIFGLSLAGWNAVISALLAEVAFRAFRSQKMLQGSSSVSQ